MGLRLLDLSASDFLDVIHYFFEEDYARVSTHEQIVVVDKTRTYIYENLYKRPYKYNSTRSDDLQYIDTPLDEDLEVSDEYRSIDPFARPNVVKPYISPTQVNADSILPFGRGIDGPIG